MLARLGGWLWRAWLTPSRTGADRARYWSRCSAFEISGSSITLANAAATFSGKCWRSSGHRVCPSPDFGNTHIQYGNGRMVIPKVTLLLLWRLSEKQNTNRCLHGGVFRGSNVLSG